MAGPRRIETVEGRSRFRHPAWFGEGVADGPRVEWGKVYRSDIGHAGSHSAEALTGVHRSARGRNDSRRAASAAAAWRCLRLGGWNYRGWGRLHRELRSRGRSRERALDGDPQAPAPSPHNHSDGTRCGRPDRNVLRACDRPRLRRRGHIGGSEAP